MADAIYPGVEYNHFYSVLCYTYQKMLGRYRYGDPGSKLWIPNNASEVLEDPGQDYCQQF